MLETSFWHNAADVIRWIHNLLWQKMWRGAVDAAAVPRYNCKLSGTMLRYAFLRLLQALQQTTCASGHMCNCILQGR